MGSVVRSAMPYHKVSEVYYAIAIYVGVGIPSCVAIARSIRVGEHSHVCVCDFEVSVDVAWNTYLHNAQG
jgi:hypothetical protein